jgi:NAD(P)-dependent dehydrogenase (short-subunit alcohol dehydrogenase family)
VNRAVIRRTQLRRLGRADEVAELALFLVSDASQFITGQVLGIDGGMSV